MVAIGAGKNANDLLLILTVAQFILLAGAGHATMRDGVAGNIIGADYTMLCIYLCRSLGLRLSCQWFYYCMRMAQGRYVNMPLALT